MDATTPKVHKHHRHHRRSNRRNNEVSSSTERQTSLNNQLQQNISEQIHYPPISPLARVHERNQQLQHQHQQHSSCNEIMSSPNLQVTTSIHHQQHNQRHAINYRADNPAVLVNGHEPIQSARTYENHIINSETMSSNHDRNYSENSVNRTLQDNTQTSDTEIIAKDDHNSVDNENSSIAAQLTYDVPQPSTTIRNQLLSMTANTSTSNLRRSHKYTITPHGSPRPGSSASNIEQNTLQQQITHKDPQASPAQRSTRSRCSLEKSPRRKRSKSESRRRRERKLIAAGEMEVRQANETLMRYLKQVSEMNDASLSGELEIDHNFDERRVHRKTKSQRDKRGHIICKNSVNKLYAAGGGLSSILKDLSEDIIPGSDIYNPFTPVVSPTEGPPSRIDKMFIQTSSGYRPVDYYKHVIDPENNKNEISTSVHLSCAFQRTWFMFSNICHGLLGGLALAHLLFIITNRPLDLIDGAIKHYASFAEIYANTFFCLGIICMVSIFDRMDIYHLDLTNASELISFRWIIITMIYIATIILTLCAETIDERIYLTNFNVTGFEGYMENNQVLNIWNSLSIARSIGAIVGWVMIGFLPGDDLLYENLLEMEKFQLTNN